MSDNTLEVGQVRVGWLYPGKVEERAGIPATLVRDKNRIRALVPVKKYSNESPESWWGTEGAIIIDGAEREDRYCTVPKNMYFIDDIGRVLLVGCKSIGGNNKIIFSSTSLGGILKKVTVEVAVFSTNISGTESFNGYKTEIEGMAEWLNFGALKVIPKFYEDEKFLRVQSVDTSVKSAGEILINDSMKFESGFTVNRNNQMTELSHKVSDTFETYSKKPVPFDEGLKTHDAIRDLLMISSWSSHQFTSIYVSHNSEKSVTGGKKWLKVISNRWGPAESVETKEKDFIFIYQDIEESGVRLWLDIRNNYSRALDPILSTIRLDCGTIENELFALCAGVEALGRYIARDYPEKSFEDGGRAYLQDALQNIINQISEGILPYVRKDGEDVNGKVLHNLPDWADKINNAYNSVKHSGGEEMNYDAIFEAIDMLKIIIVSWIGVRLGVKPEVLRDRLTRKNREFRKYLLPLDDAGYVIEEQEPEQGSEPAE